jgi:phosphatidate phosphatase APP1
MKFLITIILAFTSSLTLASVAILSDLDDTIKITNSGEEIDGAINAFLTDDVFTGIPEFLKEAQVYAPDLHILSASPKFLRAKISASLQKRNIPVRSITLKNSLGGESKFQYKVAAIKKLIENSGDDFVLIGDDVGQDPEAYAEIRRLFPNRILATYIHVIKNRSFTGTKYWSTFDLALREYQAGRMHSSAVTLVAEKILREPKFSYVIPSFAHCPSSLEVWRWQTGTMFSYAAFAVATKISSQCLVRSSGI